jgi:uncharacterized membrane protein YbhN (UPF0104 family)
LWIATHAHNFRSAVDALTDANPLGIAAAVAFASLTYVATAARLRAASGRDLRVGRTIAAQLAAACANRMVPANLGGVATNIRYLECEGAPRSEAVASLGLTALASCVVHVTVLLLILPFARVPNAGGMHDVRAHLTRAPLLVLALALVVAGVLYLARLRVARLRRPLADVYRSVVSIGRSPRRAAVLFGSAICAQLARTLAFATAVWACGVHLSFVDLAAALFVGSAMATTAPTPSGLGALEATLVAALTSLGAAAPAAVAGVLTFRVVTYWLPIVPGALALRVLRGRPIVASRDGCARRHIRLAPRFVPMIDRRTCAGRSTHAGGCSRQARGWAAAHASRALLGERVVSPAFHASR